MKTMLLLGLGLCLCAAAGCSQEPNEPLVCCDVAPVKDNSYIQGFEALDTLYLAWSTSLKVDKEKKTFGVSGEGNAAAPFSVEQGLGFYVVVSGALEHKISWNEGNMSYYNELLTKIGDTLMSQRPSENMIAMADTLLDMVLTCNKPIDALHPAGASLNDVFSVYCHDPVAVVQHRYGLVSGGNYYLKEDVGAGFPYAFFGSSLATVDWRAKPHVGSELVLVLEQAPSETGEYAFTISITNTQGKTITATTPPITIKGRN